MLNEKNLFTCGLVLASHISSLSVSESAHFDFTSNSLRYCAVNSVYAFSERLGLGFSFDTIYDALAPKGREASFGDMMDLFEKNRVKVKVFKCPVEKLSAFKPPFIAHVYLTINGKSFGHFTTVIAMDGQDEIVVVEPNFSTEAPTKLSKKQFGEIYGGSILTLDSF